MWPFKKSVKLDTPDFPVDGALGIFRALTSKKIEGLPVAESFQLMMDFYRDFRPISLLPLSEGGDMLLYQWGIFDWGAGPSFEIDLTRQFIVPDGEDSELIQMHLLYRYPVNEIFSEIAGGNVWCEHPDKLPVFQTLVLESPQLIAAARQPSVPADLSLEVV